MIKLPVTVGMLKKLKAENLAEPDSLGWEFQHSPDDTTLLVDANFFSVEALAKLKLINNLVSHGDKMKLTMRIKKWESITGSAKGEKASINLITLADQFKTYLNQHAPNGWVFMELTDGNLLPYFVQYVGYYPPSDRHDVPRTAFHLQHSRGGKTIETIVRIYQSDLKGGKQSLGDLLDKKGMTIENEALVKDYLAEIELFKKYSSMVGKQFLAEGKAQVYDSWSYRTHISLGMEGKPDKVIVESNEILKKQQEAKRYYNYYSSHSTSTAPKDKAVVFWTKRDLHPPVHPYIFIFNLRVDRYMEVSSTCLKPYVYRTDMDGLIVLPEETRDILDIVLKSDIAAESDVVEGKSGGLAILASGDPGTGKTLTAEVTAEMMQKPLYRVHSSQLGITAPELEKNLQDVLSRAERWEAILLLDEADVYIHKRGKDLNQAAVVGVWLRLLEYYNGILFMTSNRATIVDDAILSRLAVHIKYFKPVTEDLKKIWTLLAHELDAKITPANIDKIVEVYSTVSGRDVKNLIKLAKRYSAKKEVPITVDVIKKIAKYKNVHETVERD